MSLVVLPDSCRASCVLCCARCTNTIPPVKLGDDTLLCVIAMLDQSGSLVFSYVESVGYDEWSKWSNIAMTQAVLASWIRLDHWMRILIQDLGSTFLAYGRHLWHVDPNDPTFRSRTLNIFRDGYVRINVRCRPGESLHASCFFFFYGSHTYYYYYLAFRRQIQWSTILDQSWIKAGSTWIKVIQMIQLLDQSLPFQYRLIHVWSKV